MVAWVKHTYQPFVGGYNPTATVNDHGYVGSYQGYLLWRDTQCANKAHSWGQSVICTEFGKSYTLNGAAKWFNDVTASMEKTGYIGWTVHSYEQPDQFNILKNINWYMTALTPHIGKLQPIP